MRDRAFSVTGLPGFATIAVAVFVLLYLPIVTLVAYSFHQGTSPSVWEGFSLHWYALAWANDQVKDAAMVSLIVASFAAVISTAVASMRNSKKSSNALLASRGLRAVKKDHFRVPTLTRRLRRSKALRTRAFFVIIVTPTKSRSKTLLTK